MKKKYLRKGRDLAIGAIGLSALSSVNIGPNYHQSLASGIGGMLPATGTVIGGGFALGAVQDLANMQKKKRRRR